MIKKILDGKKMKVYQNVYLTYLLAIYLLIPCIPFYFIFNYLSQKKPEALFFAVSIMYFLIYIFLEKVIYKKIEWNKNKFIGFFILNLIIKIMFSYIFTPIALVFILRKLKIKDSMFVGFELIKNNIFRILFIYISHIAILSFALSIFLFIKLSISGIILLSTDEIYQYIAENSSILSYFPPIIFSISSFLLYKNLEQNDIIRGGKNG